MGAFSADVDAGSAPENATEAMRENVGAIGGAAVLAEHGPRVLRDRPTSGPPSSPARVFKDG